MRPAGLPAPPVVETVDGVDYFATHDHIRTEEVRELKVCQGCKFARKIVVRYRAVSDRRGGDGAALWRATSYFAHFCGACNLEARARDHRETAARFEVAAATIRRKRRAR